MLGWLECNATTGRVQLVDQTGAVDCVIAQSAESVHRDTDADLLQPHHMAELFLIHKVDVMVERFICSHYPSLHDIGDPAFLRSLTTRIYLQFSMCDVTIVSPDKYAHTTNTQTTKRCAPQAGHLEQYNAKKNKLSEGASSDGMTTVVPTVIKPTIRYPCVCQQFVLVQKDSMQLRNRVTSGGKLCFYALACFVGGQQVVESDIDEAVCDRSSASTQLAALSFHEDNIHWYPLLTVGCIYVLVKNGCRDAVLRGSRSGHAGLQQALDTCGTRQCISVTSDMLIIPHNSHNKQVSIHCHQQRRKYEEH